MLKRSPRFLFVFFLVLGYVSVTKAQDECELTLLKATEEFNAGHFYSIPSLLKECMDKHQTHEWRQRANLLLSETYLLLEDPLGAEKSYLEVLHANPEYIPDQSRDPIDLVYLSSKFTATPIFTLFGKLGLNTSIVRPILHRNMYAHDEKYKLRTGFHLGGGVDWNYNDNISATVEANYVLSSYRYESSNVFPTSYTFRDTISGVPQAKIYQTSDNIVLVDKQSWITIPLSVKYGSSRGKYRPYGYVGLSIELLVGDRATISYSDRNINLEYNDATKPKKVTSVEIQAEEQVSPILKFGPKRNTFNRSFFVGGGVKYKLGLRYAFVDVRYSFGLTNVVNVDNSIYDYSQKDKTSDKFQTSANAIFTWGHLDNLFRMDNLYVSVGYSYPLYNPRKLKKARSKSVFKSIKKQSNEVTPD